MTGIPQNPLQVPLYKICCLIPYQVNEQEIVYLSSTSEINRFLQVHGIGDKFRVDSGRSSTATCTEDLPLIPETRKILITNDVGGKCKETYDRQIQYNWKNVNNTACYRNEIFQWHKCSKNESVVHFCKKSNSSICDDTNSCSLSQNIKKKMPKAIHKYPDLEVHRGITPIDALSLKKISQKRPEPDKKKKKTYSFTNKSFIKILKKRNTKLHTPVIEPKKEVFMKEKSTGMCDKTIDNKISLLAESVVCETSKESSYISEELANTNQKEINLDEIKSDAVSPNGTIIPPVEISISKDYNNNDDNDKDVQLKEENKEMANSDDFSDSLSNQSSTFDCSMEQNNQNVDLTFYESPSKFVENMSECVMRRFIGEECEDSWLKLYEGKKIKKKHLGIDKDLSELYILKKMVKHENATCLISHLTPRQKRLLAKGIVQTLDEFNIKGSRWGGLSREILSSVCKLFKIQQGLV